MSEPAILSALVIMQILWVSLPLLPAVLIYKLFSTTTVGISGPFAALTINTTGAFAAYFLVLLATYPISNTSVDTIGGFQKTYWTVKATVTLVGKDSAIIPPPRLLDDLSVQTMPRSYSNIAKDVKIAIPGIKPESVDFPFIVFSIQNFGKTGIDLKSVKYSIDRFHKTVTIEDPITIAQD